MWLAEKHGFRRNSTVCTVAISTCNSAGYFRACLEQLLEQSLRVSFEVIVIDSGSDEDESAICAQYAARFAALTCVRTPRETLYSAWNRALALAKGRYFINANTDDSLHPDALQLLVAAMEAHPESALAYGDWLWATVPNAPYPWDSSYRRCVHQPYHPSLPLFYAYAGCHQFWRTDKLRELGGFNASYAAAGDYDALCRMAMKRWHAVYVPEAISAFYQNPHGLSRSSGRSVEEFATIQDRFRDQVSIADLYDVDAESANDCARAWIDLAHRALSLRVPWAEEAVPDAEFAAQCVRKALDLDPANQEAKDLLALSGKSWRGLMKRTWSSRANAFTRTTADRSTAPRARTPAPVFRMKEAASI
jgi:glycosyltransferase involved in cell wall biosynthesis